ncbi:MAG: glycosyltransferase family 2 protein [Campylobacteraceae bacterium]|jgi:glycosyltransferase involved in cell wall biosynthesis|nr:glycosyltransferase family 2 protein [Campylobacteraceae bacterium]
MLDMSILILTKNEEKNIVDVIRNAKKCSENVFIIDSGSTDNTVALAKKNKAKVLFRTWDNDFAAQRNFGLQEVSTKWVLYIDADERLNDELIENIKEAVKKDESKQYIIKRKYIAFDQEFNYGVLRPNFVSRLFPRESVKWINKVHERALCDLPKVYLKGYMKHYTYTSWEQYINKINQYTTIWAQNAHENGKKTGIAKAFLHAFGGFFQMTFIKKGILEGKIGVVISCCHFFYTLMKYVKLYQLQRQDKSSNLSNTGKKRVTK